MRVVTSAMLACPPTKKGYIPYIIVIRNAYLSRLKRLDNQRFDI